jgi:putative hydrolase of the HAD superfamily
MYKNIKVIAFDADDTLWVNEPYFHQTERDFCNLLKDFGTEEEISKTLYNTEIQNLSNYGFGTKGFMLSMIETALKVSNNDVPQSILRQIIDLGKAQLNKDIELLPGVVEVLENLKKQDYRLIVATKGDLLDQERKLQKSGLEKYFHHIEIMSDKKESDYQKLIKHLDIESNDFLMIGNSLKSDILPILNLGGNAIYIPYHTTWVHEKMDESELDKEHYHKVENIKKVLDLIA